MKIDFHSHILPRMDDGASNVEEAVELLGLLKNDSVDTVIATPHLYLHKDSLESFLSRRGHRSKELSEAIEKKKLNIPKILIGAEVYFSPGVERLNLRDLCIEGTDYLLLELPYAPFTPVLFKSLEYFIYDVCEKEGINVIFAHIERYYDFNPAQMVEYVLNFGLICQGNCESTLFHQNRKHLFNLIRSGKIQVLGTDMHGLEYRPPIFGQAEEAIKKEFSDMVFEAMMNSAEKILANEKSDIVKVYFKKASNLF